ncbi:MAG: hypothetical protein QM784_27250 [Polyangiaceae bacterium]
MAAERLEAARDGHVKVRVQVEASSPLGERRIQYQIIGYVPEAALGARAGQVGVGDGGPSVKGGSERFELPRGTRFYDCPDGNIVGVALSSVFVGEGPASGEKGPATDWSRLSLRDRGHAVVRRRALDREVTRGVCPRRRVRADDAFALTTRSR